VLTLLVIPFRVANHTPSALFLGSVPNAIGVSRQPAVSETHNLSRIGSRAQTDNHVAYLPLVSANFLHTTASRYYTSTAFLYNYWLGCKQGKDWPDQASGVIILDFGQPWHDGNSYGANLWPYPFPFQSIDEIETAVRGYVVGFVNCAITQQSHQKWANVYIAAGVNNVGQQVGAGHGAAWAQMVNRLNQFLASQSATPRIRARGAIDAEPLFGPASAAIQWADGYSSAFQGDSLYYNFGSCDACPSVFYPNWIPENSWTLSDVYHVSWGATAALPFPDIYATDGINAWQWQYVTLWSYLNYGSARMYSKGVFTQWAACQTNGPCEGPTDNRPAEGWEQFTNALNSDPRTGQYLEYSSDIRWPAYDYLP